MKKVLLILIGILLPLHVFSAPNYWGSSFAQGYAEYRVENSDGYIVTIACNEGAGDDWDHGVSVSKRGMDGPFINDDGGEAPIEFAIYGDLYDVPEETFTRSGSQAWKGLVDNLSTANMFELFWNGEYLGVFTPKNPKSVERGLKSCNPMGEKRYNNQQENKTRVRDTPPPQSISQNPFRVKKSYYDPLNTGLGGYKIDISSLENDITITGVSVNRGNCRILRTDPVLPVRLRFGQTAYVVLYKSCNILEIGISTNKGSVSYSF